ADLGERELQVLLDVVRQRAQGGDVEHLRLVLELRALPEQRIDRGQEGGQRLAGPRGRGDQGVAALADERPSVELGGGGLAEPALEPGLYGRMEGIERGHDKPFYRLGCRPGNNRAGA